MVDVENELMAHPAVAEATVVGLKHLKWQERPAAFVVVAGGAEVTEDDLRAHLSERVAKWWLPDEIVFVDEIPKTGTGKFEGGPRSVRGSVDGGLSGVASVA